MSPPARGRASESLGRSQGCEMARCRLADEHSSGAGRREIDRILYSISDEGQMSRKPESPKHQSIVLYSP